MNGRECCFTSLSKNGTGSFSRAERERQQVELRTFRSVGQHGDVQRGKRWPGRRETARLFFGANCVDFADPLKLHQELLLYYSTTPEHWWLPKGIELRLAPRSPQSPWPPPSALFCLHQAEKGVGCADAISAQHGPVFLLFPHAALWQSVGLVLRSHGQPHVDNHSHLHVLTKRKSPVRERCGMH